MKRIFSIGLIALSLFSCKKDNEQPTPDPLPSHPAMTYFDLTGKTISYNNPQEIDLDADGKYDVRFHVQLVADNIFNLVKTQFIARSSITSNLSFVIIPANGEDEVPALDKGKKIILTSTTDTNWYNAGSAVLMQKVEDANTNKTYFERNWTDKGRRYLAVQVMKDEAKFNGWIELEAKSSEQKLILYRAAISKEANKDIIAGFE